MLQAMLDRLDEWRERLRKADAWDSGDCTLYEMIRTAIMAAHSKGE